MSLVKICWEQRKYQSSMFNPNFLFLIKLLFRHHLEESWQCRPGYLRNRILSINSSQIYWQNSKVDTHCKSFCKKEIRCWWSNSGFFLVANFFLMIQQTCWYLDGDWGSKIAYIKWCNDFALFVVLFSTFVKHSTELKNSSNFGKNAKK